MHFEKLVHFSRVCYQLGALMRKALGLEWDPTPSKACVLFSYDFETVSGSENIPKELVSLSTSLPHATHRDEKPFKAKSREVRARAFLMNGHHQVTDDNFSKLERQDLGHCGETIPYLRQALVPHIINRY